MVFLVEKVVLNQAAMKSQKEILKWLQANLGKCCTAPLTSTDCYALVTSVNLCNLISYSSAPPELFFAYGAIVRQMQPHTRGLAYNSALLPEQGETNRAGNCRDNPSGQ